jgi:hypothetical protein
MKIRRRLRQIYRKMAQLEHGRAAYPKPGLWYALDRERARLLAELNIGGNR